MENNDQALDLKRDAKEYRDKALGYLFTVATGALTFSVTFRDSIVGDEPRALWLLKSSWVCLVICIIFNIAFYFGVGTAFHFISSLPRKIRKQNEEVKSSLNESKELVRKLLENKIVNHILSESEKIKVSGEARQSILIPADIREEGRNDLEDLKNRSRELKNKGSALEKFAIKTQRAIIFHTGCGIAIPYFIMLISFILGIVGFVLFAIHNV